MQDRSYRSKIKKRGHIKRVLTIYGVIFFMLLTPISMVHAASTSISLSQYSGPPGTTIWINGTGFSANSNVNIYWDGSYQDTTSTDANGNFSYQFTIPSSTSGTHTISASDGSNSASADFTVVPEIILSDNSGYVGTTLSVNGAGFSGNSRVYLYWDSTYLGRTTTDSNGAFSFTFSVPASPYGLHTIKAIDSNENQATASFLVLSHITLSTSTGYFGKTITYYCSGYSAEARISIIWNYGMENNIVLDSETTDTTGSYSGTFTVPEGKYGYHNITGIDEFSHSDTTTLFIIPKLEISPGNGYVNTKVYITGYGFSASSNININWSNGATLNTSTSNTIGTFHSVIYIPYSTSGNHLITATDSNSVQTSAVFDVTPQITISPNYGNSGDTSIVTATGFSGSSSIEIYWDFGLSTETELATGTTNSTGTYSTTVTIPNGTNTTHIIAGIDANNNIAQTQYYLGPHIYINPNNGFVGSNIIVNGTCFSTNSNVNIYWDGKLVSTTKTNATGYFSISFSVPHSSYGYHEVMASDEYGHSATANYMVTAHITISKNKGNVFNNISIDGSGFSANSAVYIYWDGNNTQRSMITNSTGDFTLTFKIPESIAGTHVIYGEDLNGVLSNTQNFTVTPSIKLSNYYGNIGMTYEIYCYGFGASVTINMIWDSNSEPYYTTSNSIGSGIIKAVVPNSTMGEHSIEVYDSHLNWAGPVNFTVIPPSAPNPYGPKGYVNSSTITLTWSSVDYATTYIVEYGTNPNFNNSIIINTPSNHTTISGLSNGKTYYWRVRAIDENGNAGNYSITSSFKVDTTSPTSKIYIPVRYSNSTHLLIFYNASDSISGISKVELYYSFNGSNFLKYDTKNESTGVFDFYAKYGNGNYSFYTISYDCAGNMQKNSKIVHVFVDTTPPSSYITSLPTYSRKHTIEIYYKTSDIGSGVDYVKLYWSKDGTEWNYYGEFNSTPILFLAQDDGTYYFKTIAVDKAGNVQLNTPVIASTTVDTIPPASGIYISGTIGNNGWFISPVKITLRAFDTTSGVKATYYEINNSGYTLYNSPITIEENGVYRIHFYSVDTAGNAEQPKQVIIKIDRTSPSLSIVTPTPREVLSGTVALKLRASDTNILGVYYRIDYGPWINTYNSGNIWNANIDTVKYSDGFHKITVLAIDDAGNKKFANVSVYIDNEKPKIIDASLPTGVVSGRIRFSVFVTDSVGINNVVCKLSSKSLNKTYNMYRTTLNIYSLSINTTSLSNGKYTITIIAENYGNKTNMITRQFTIDNSPPTVIYPGSSIVRGETTLIFHVKDNTTGIASAWISIDNSEWIKVPIKNGIIRYHWNTVLRDNGIHRVEVKVVDYAGNENIYETSIKVDNQNYMPIIFIIVLIVILIIIIIYLKIGKNLKKDNEELKSKDKNNKDTQEMYISDSEKNDIGIDLSDLELGGDRDE